MGQNLGHRIKVARTDARLSQAELGARVGVSRSAIASYENNLSEPSIDIIKAIARATGKPVSYFIEESDDSELLSQAERIAAILRLQMSPVKIPILGKVPAGDWEDASLPEAVDTISLDETLGKQASFGLWAEGQSMYPTIQHGDLVLVQQGRLPRNRDIVVVRNEHGEATLKRYINLRGKVFLKPDNPDYGEPTSETGIVVGVVVGVVRYLVGVSV